MMDLMFLYLAVGFLCFVTVTAPLFKAGVLAGYSPYVITILALAYVCFWPLFLIGGYLGRWDNRD